jgi:hypothetical protein
LNGPDDNNTAYDNAPNEHPPMKDQADNLTLVQQQFRRQAEQIWFSHTGVTYALTKPMR